MKDVELINLLATRIEAALAAYPYADLSSVPVQKKQQPTQQGIPLGNQIWFELLFSIPCGWSMKSFSFVNDTSHLVNGYFNDKEDQIYQTHFQISGMFPEVPGDTSIPTANDVLTYIARYLTHKQNIKDWFKNNKVSLYRIKENNNMKIFDDMSQFESFPSFDIILIHRNALELEVPAVVRVDPNSLGGIPF